MPSGWRADPDRPRSPVRASRPTPLPDWVAAATPATTLLVTFALEPECDGTRLRMTETGFRERGWEIAALEETLADHERGWDLFLPRLVTRAEHLAIA